MVVPLPPDLTRMTAEIQLALGLAPLESRLTLYQRFSLEELTDALDQRLMALFRGYLPLRFEIEGYLCWNEVSGCLYYPVKVLSAFMNLRRELGQLLPTPTLKDQAEPHLVLGTISSLGFYQRDLVERLYFPITWSTDRVELESEVKPSRWVLEAAFTLGENRD